MPNAIALILIGAASAAIWIFAFTNQYSLAQYGDLSWQSLGTLSGLSGAKAALFIGGFALLFGLYWLGARYTQKANQQRWAIVLGFGLLFNVVLLPMYPVDAADLYDNVIRGRMSADYGLNPFAAKPTQIPADPFFRFSAWRNVTTAYGPAWETIASLTSRIAGDDYTANVYAFKLVPIIGSLLTAILIGLALRRITPERALLGAYLFAWNPLVIYSTGQGGHNDTLMTTCVALSMLFLVRRRYALATYAAVAGVLVKFIPLLIIPVIWLMILRDLKGAARWRSLLACAIGGVVIAAIGYIPYWAGPDTLRLDRLGGMFTGSIAVVLRELLMPLVTTGTATTLVKLITLGAFAILTLVLLVRYWRELRTNDSEDLWRAISTMAWIVAAYLLIATSWFQAWYISWLLVLIAFLPDVPVRRFALVFSYLVTWEGWLYNFVSFRYNGWMPAPWIDLIPVVFYVGGAVIYLTYLISKPIFQGVGATSIGTRDKIS